MATIELIDQAEFFRSYEAKMFYVAFLKSKEAWFPFCTVDNGSAADQLNTLYVSSSKEALEEILDFHTQRVPQIEQTLVHHLMAEEAANVVERYGLLYVAYARPDSADEKSSEGSSAEKE